MNAPYALELRLYEHFRSRGCTSEHRREARDANLVHRYGAELLALWTALGYTGEDLRAAAKLNRQRRTASASRLERRAA